MSREFAEKNGLAVGGTFSVRRATVHAQMAGIDVEDTRTQVSVTGIFELTAKSRADLASWSMDNAIFGTISTLDHARRGLRGCGGRSSPPRALRTRAQPPTRERRAALARPHAEVGGWAVPLRGAARRRRRIRARSADELARRPHDGGIGAGPLVAPRMALGQTLANPTAQSTTAARRAARHPARPPWARRSRAGARRPAPARAGPPPPQAPPPEPAPATAHGSHGAGAPPP